MSKLCTDTTLRQDEREMSGCDQDELLRERQLNGDFLDALNQVLELCQRQGETIKQQHELIVELRGMVGRYSGLIDTQVKPALELFLQQKGTQ